MLDFLLNPGCYQVFGLVVVVVSLFLMPCSRSMLTYVKIGAICFIGATLLSYFYP